jgi:hypothetical protein
VDQGSAAPWPNVHRRYQLLGRPPPHHKQVTGPKGHALSGVPRGSAPWPCFRLSPRRRHLRLLRLVRRAPQIPCRNRSMRRPRCADLRQHFRLRLRLQPIQMSIAIPYAEIVHRQHVRPPQREDQQHLHRPSPHAANRRQPLDQIGVGQSRRTAPCRHRAIHRRGTDRPHRRDLRLRKAARPQLVVGTRQHHLRRRKFAIGIKALEPRQDRLRGPAMQLLVRNRPHQRFIRTPLPLNAKARRAYATNQRSKILLAPEMTQCLFIHGDGY